MSTCAGPSLCMTMVTPHARAPVPACRADGSSGRGAHCDGNDLITGVTAQHRRRGLNGRTSASFSPRTGGVGRPQAGHKNPAGLFPETHRQAGHNQEAGERCPHRARSSSAEIVERSLLAPPCLIGSNHGVFLAACGAPAAEADPQRSPNCPAEWGDWEAHDLDWEGRRD